jgi:hypothetical protein
MDENSNPNIDNGLWALLKVMDNDFQERSPPKKKKPGILLCFSLKYICAVKLSFVLVEDKVYQKDIKFKDLDPALKALIHEDKLPNTWYSLKISYFGTLIIQYTVL